MRFLRVLATVCVPLAAACLALASPALATPHTTSDADGAWRNTAATVHFSATDPIDSVDHTEYSEDGGATWTPGTAVAVPAPADHSADGVHEILFRSVDTSANVEDAHACEVKIDTTGPDTWNGWYCHVVEGRTAHVWVAITDGTRSYEPLSPTAHATMHIYTVVKREYVELRTVDMGTLAVMPPDPESFNPWEVGNRFLWPCDLPVGDYWFWVDAVDEAGNTLNHADSAPFVVMPYVHKRHKF